MEYADTFIILATVFGFFMAWGVGANDVANAMGTSVGSKAITLRQAILIAMVFEASGALLAGGQVTHTIRAKIISPEMFQTMPEVFVIGMLSALLSAGIWLTLAAYRGWPVSTTHSIVGAIIGFGAISVGLHAVNWSVVGGIVASWVVTPVIAGIISFFIFKSIQNFILNDDEPLAAAKRCVPYYIFLVSSVISMVTLVKGLKHIGLELNFVYSMLLSFVFAFLCVAVGMYFLRFLRFSKGKTLRIQYRNVERVFGVLMIFTACAMAFAHGSNDVANAIGPLAAIVSLVTASGEVVQQSTIPFWVLLVGAGGIVVGLATYGYRMIEVIGTHITELTPSRGFSAEIATAITVIMSSGTGLPVSTTQTLVGAIMGVGFARGIGALNIYVIRNIFVSWVVTLPAGALLAVIIFYFLRYIYC